MDEEFFTINEVAQRLKVTRAALYKWMGQGKLAFKMVGSRRRISSSDLAAFIKPGEAAIAQPRGRRHTKARPQTDIQSGDVNFNITDA